MLKRILSSTIGKGIIGKTKLILITLLVSSVVTNSVLYMITTTQTKKIVALEESNKQYVTNAKNDNQSITNLKKGHENAVAEAQNVADECAVRQGTLVEIVNKRSTGLKRVESVIGDLERKLKDRDNTPVSKDNSAVIILSKDDPILLQLIKQSREYNKGDL